MAAIIEITDISAPELDMFARLTEPQLRSKRHKELGVFIAETPKVIEAALDGGCRPAALLMERRHITGSCAGIIRRCGDVPVYTADESVLRELTGYSLTRGALCAMHRPAVKSAGEVLEGACRVAVLEDVVDSTNVGTIFGSAAALGMDGVLLSPSCADPLLRRAVRVSMGTVFKIPWARIGDSAADWPEKGMTVLKQYGFVTAAMALRDDCVSVEDETLAKCDKLALILGTEGTGLREKTIELSDHAVKIPMSAGVDSLNVAAAGAVAFWQLRKRTGEERNG